MNCNSIAGALWPDVMRNWSNDGTVIVPENGGVDIVLRFARFPGEHGNLAALNLEDIFSREVLSRWSASLVGGTLHSIALSAY